MSLLFSGIGVSRGIAIGPVAVVHRGVADVDTRELEAEEVAGEARRLRRAIKTARVRLLGARDAIPKDAAQDVSAFIETHLLMLDDALLSQRPIEIVKVERINAEAALARQKRELSRVFETMEDGYLATRVDDVNHVIDAVLRELADGGSPEPEDPVDDTRWQGRLVVADDLTPADTISMQQAGVAGFVTETGGPLSHTAILARSLGIPAVVGAHGLARALREGETLVIDGASGLVLAEATVETLDHFRVRMKEDRRHRRELSRLIDTEPVTEDGVRMTLMANIDIEEDIKALRRVNADGVGLYRTEFLYLNRDTLPSEAEHLKVYLRVLRALRGAPLTIRTADLGADKLPAGRAAEAIGTAASHAASHNPALGLRGIRLCLADTALFVPQLRAILRAATRGPVRILLPMLTGVDEIRQCRELVAETAAALEAEGVEIGHDVPVGGMIEVPASAIEAPAFAAELDFLSIGTNDLIQYTLAIDRVDDRVNYLYDPFHPAVLALIRRTIDAGAEAGIPVSLCGEMAGDPSAVRLLAGLGLTEFSMPPALLLEVKRSLIGARHRTLVKQARAYLRAPGPDERAVALERLNA